MLPRWTRRERRMRELRGHASCLRFEKTVDCVDAAAGVVGWVVERTCDNRNEIWEEYYRLPITESSCVEYHRLLGLVESYIHRARQSDASLLSVDVAAVVDGFTRQLCFGTACHVGNRQGLRGDLVWPEEVAHLCPWSWLIERPLCFRHNETFCGSAWPSTSK